MRRKHSKWIAILTIATLLAGQTVTVWADEVTDVPEVIEASDIGIEDAVTEESATDSSETETVSETEEVGDTETVTETEEVEDAETVTETEEATEETETVMETSTEAATEDMANVPMLLAETETVTETATEEEPSTEEEVAELVAPTVTWDSDYPGDISWDNPNDVSVLMTFSIVYGNNPSTSPFGFGVYEPGEGGGYGMSMTGRIKESGDYTAVVKVFPADISFDEMREAYEDWDIYATSSVYSYTYPNVELPVVEDITFSSTGIVSWTAPEETDRIDSYLVTLYDVSGATPTYVAGMSLSSNYGHVYTSYDFLDYMTEGVSYAATVQLYSNNIEEVYHGPESDLVPLDDSGIVDEVNATLSDSVDSLSDDSTAEEVTTAVADVKTAFADTESKRELQYAMQTNSDTQAQIEKLEGLYEEALGVSTAVNVAEDAGIDSSKISLLGASLNATEAGEVSFDVSVPSEEKKEELIGRHSDLNNIVCFSLNLEGAGVTSGNLAVPVTITMPAPEGINASWLRVYHYTSSGAYESVTVRNNGDGTVSFTVTHFSEFVFGEVEPTSSSSSNSSDSKKESKPWTPTTEDEKERYSVFGREKLDYIVGTEGGYQAKLVNAMQGRLFFDTVDAAKGDYTVARTYNVEIDGKLVYETAMPAMFVLNIPEEYLAAGRDYKMVCVTQNGEVVILDDLDTAAETITFLTNKFYAFALIYKDAVVTE